MNSQQSIEWQFGTWSGLSPWLAWGIIVGAAGIGVLLSIWFYRDTLRALLPRQRLIFAGLRSGFFLCLLLCLASPARVEKIFDSNHDARPLAVLVDRSPSMNVADVRGTTRLSYALRLWKSVEADAIRCFPGISWFRFSSEVASAADLEAAVTGRDTGPDTHLFDSLEQLLKNAPPGGYGGIVCLTDGLDTTNVTPEQLGARALQDHSPLYFAVGENQQASHDTLLVREMDVPGQVLRKSRFSASVLVEAHASRDRDVPLSLWSSQQQIGHTSLHLHRGANLIPWSTDIDALEPGLMQLDCRLGEGSSQEDIAASLRVVAQDKVRVLFYQGTLDWSFRFINNALSGDPSFVLSGLFNPSLNLTQSFGSRQAPPVPAMPENADALQPFQIVVLANAFGDQFSAAQESALVKYVEGGGGLLFLVSDNNMARTFSGTALESVLPVIFEAPAEIQSHDESVREFQEKMREVGGSNYPQETDYVAEANTQAGPDPLKAFALPPNLNRPEIAKLFSAGAGGMLRNAPRFAQYARVHAIKAGGEVLAVHPEDRTDTNEMRALLVTQRFGRGRVTALLTDALWRWRLSLPSTSRDPEIFWQQLFIALAHLESGQAGMRFAMQPFFASINQLCAYRLDGAFSAGAPVITAFPPEGKPQAISAQAGGQAGSWSFQFAPYKAGTWRIRAQDDKGGSMETLLRVSQGTHTDELSGLPPDIEGLRKLADATGGSLLNDGVPNTWSAANAQTVTTLLSRHTQPLWNNWAVMMLGLGFYMTELIWRRRAKLL